MISGPFVIVYIPFCFVKIKNNIKNILFVLMTVRIRQNNRRFVKGCFVSRWFVKFYRDVPNKMAASSKLSLHINDGVTV
jgi:hypothetical protein